MHRRFAVIVSTSIALSFFSGCRKAEQDVRQDKPVIAVSIDPLRNIVERIAGDRYEVITLLDKGANPETFDPSMSKRAAADHSVAFFTVGAFPFEKAIEKSGNGKSRTIDASAGIRRLYDTHGHHEAHDCSHEGDPHTWTSVRNMKVMAGNITKSLAELDSDNSALYETRLDSLNAELDSLDNSIGKILADVRPKAFAIWHPSLGYLSKDYGLRQIAVGEESKEVSPRRLKEIIATAAGDSVKVFFFQREFDSRQASSINDQIGSRLVDIDLLDYDWTSQIELIANELAR